MYTGNNELKNIRRGDIFYITPSEAFAPVGNEMWSGRPGIIVSNNSCNDKSGVVEVVYLTTQFKKEIPTHVIIGSSGTRSTALCESIYSVDKARVGDYCGTCSDTEMQRIDLALMISLGITNTVPTVSYRAQEDIEELEQLRDKVKKLTTKSNEDSEVITQLRAQIALLKSMYIDALKAESGITAANIV